MKPTPVSRPKPARTQRVDAIGAGPALAAPPAVPVEVREESIRRTAYAYYEARGYAPGHELEDWLKAEAEFERITGALGADAGTPQAH